MSGPTTWRSSSSTSATTRTAARDRPAASGGPTTTLLIAAAIFLAAIAPPAGPITAAEPPCVPLGGSPALAEPAAGDIYLKPGTGACDGIVVEVMGRDLDRVLTVSFDLKFPAGILAYDGYAAGTFFEQGPPRSAPLYLVRSISPGIIAVSITRFAPDPPVGAAGDAVLLGLRFKRIAAGNGTIDFHLEPSSPTSERVLGADGSGLAARFGPRHGATLVVP